LLRRSLSAMARIPAKDIAEACSDSDSDLPDAQSLLKSPAQRTRANEKQSLSGKASPIKLLSKQGKDRAKPVLAKAASEIVHTNNEEGLDDMFDLKPLKVPGELVLAYAIRKYYPARVEQQVSPQRYLVRFFDGSKSLLSKKRIYTMYDNEFYTCPLGAIQLIGDEPAKSTEKRIDTNQEDTIDLERDFERDKKLFASLVKEVEAIKHYLDILHACKKETICTVKDMEDRMPIFFGDDQSQKRLLSSRVSKGHLNRAEFDFLGRLLSRWYELPPAASTEPVNSVKSKESTESSTCTSKNVADGKKEQGCSRLQAMAVGLDELGASALAIQFVHEVLLPHTIKRLITVREKCSLSEAEIRMAREDSSTQWPQMSIPPANVSSNRRHFFMSSAQLDALETKEAQERDPVRQKLGDPLRTGGRILGFEMCDNDTAVLALGNHLARVADLKAKTCTQLPAKHAGPVTGVAVLNSGYAAGESRIALSASWDKTVKLWPVDNARRTLAILVGHSDFVKCVVAHPTLPIVYTGSADKTIMVWKLPESVETLTADRDSPLEIKPSKIIKGQHTGQVQTLCLDAVSADVLYSAGSDASVRAWDAQTGDTLPVDNENLEEWFIPRGQHKTNITDIKLTETELWTASADSTAVGWDLNSRAADMVLSHKSNVTAVLPVPQAGIVITGTHGGVIYVWRTSNGSPEIIREIHAHTDDVTCLKAAGRVFYSASLDETLRVWDIMDVVNFQDGLQFMPPELAKLKAQAEPDRAVPAHSSNQPSSSVLTEEEERELAELMSDLDDM
ncbi:hypothetical protein IW138_005694, partial [Coemansia sp. RSA 986]